MDRLSISTVRESAVGLNLLDSTGPVVTMIRGTFVLRPYPWFPGVYGLAFSRLLIRMVECAGDRLHGGGPTPNPCIIEDWGSPCSILGEDFLLGIDRDRLLM